MKMNFAILKRIFQLAFVLAGAAALAPAPVHAQIAFRSAADSSTPPIAFRAAASAGIPASTTIAFRAAASAAVDSGVTTLTIAKPTGTVQGDVMITSIAIRPNTATITLLAGWTLVRRTNNTLATTGSIAVYQKVAGAAEPASYSWTLGGAPTGAAGGIQTFSGVDTTTPIDVENGAATAAATTTPATPSVTTTVANTMLVTGHEIQNRNLWANPPTWGGTQGFQVRAATAPIMLQGSWALQAAIGATGTKTATDLGGDAADNGNAHILALRPGGANLTINKPTGTVQNDVMVASVGVRPNTVTITPPAGWTLVRRMDNANATANSLAVYRLMAGASEPASYTWTLSAHTGAAGGIQSFSGVDTTTPIDVENGAPTTAATTTPATPSVTTTVANTMLVTSHSIANDDLWANPPTWGGTQGFQVIAPGGAPEMTQGSFALQAAAGATGTKTATDLGPDAADNGNAHILALRPSLTIPLPAGTVAYDVMVAQIAWRTTQTITAPAGWTLVRQTVQAGVIAGVPNRLATYFRVATAAEPASFTWTLTAGDTGAVGAILSYSGVDTAAPINAENGAATPAATPFDHTAPGITPTVPNTMLVRAYEFPTSSTWTPNPPSASITERTDIASRIVPNTGGISMAVYEEPWASAVATGTRTAQAAGGAGTDAGDGAAHHLALRPTPIGTIACASAGGGNSTLDLTGVNLSGRNAVVVFVGYNNNNFETVTSVVIDPGGASQTSMGAALASASTVDDAQIYIFGLVNPPQGTFTIRVTFSAALLANHGSNICAYSLSGVNTANAFGTPGTNAAVSGNGSVVVPSAAGELVLAGLAGETIGLSTVAAPAGEDADIQGGSGTTVHHLATAHQDGAAPSVTFSWTHTSDHWAAAGISVRFGGPPPPGSFNAFETSTAAGAITGVIRTKVAGTAFSLDVVAIASGAQLTGFTDAVIVELLGNNTLGVPLDAQNCPTSFTLVQTVTPNPTITGGRSTVSFAAVPNSWRDVRVRIRWPTTSPTVTSCSTDNFAIRPNTFASFAITDTDWQTAGTVRALNDVIFGTVTHKAGRPLSVRATAVNAAGTPAVTTNYAGAPTATLTACVGAACTATFGTPTLTTTFVAGQLTSDVASYDNVGSFGLQLVDSTFASVDSPVGDTPGDCTATGRYVCSATINVGRFVPDHFAVLLNAPTFGTTCGSFTYIGQAFNYTTAPVITVTAQGFANNTTTLYADATKWWRITNTSVTPATQLARYSAAIGTLDVNGLPAVAADPTIVSAGSGMGTLTFSSGTGVFFTRTTPTAPASPYDADISLAINVIDADGVILASNPARFGTATAGNGIAFSSGKPMRFGRLTLRNANGSQLVPLPVLMEAQHWNGTAFITNTADSCTSIAAGNVAMSNFTQNLAACETAISGGGVLSAGRKTLQLAAPGSANNGSVDLTVNLGASASGNTCTAVGAGPGPLTTTANLPYLQGNWTGINYDQNPSARATFGVYPGSEEVIFIRENF